VAVLLRTFDERIDDPSGSRYRPRVCGRERDDGSWEGWLEFVPEDGTPVLRSERETTQPNRTDVEYWASGLSQVDAEGALARTLEPARPVRAVRRDRPAYGGPAPQRRGAGPVAILDPFSVYRRGGGELLRRELSALDAWHLRNIAAHYRLVDGRRADPEREPKPVLIARIVSGVAAREISDPG
jgi:hypothetical protein